MLVLNYSITKEDYVNAYTYLLWDAPEKRNRHLRYYGQQLLINGAFVALLFYSGLLNSRPSWKYLYIGILAMIVVLQFFSGRAKIKKQADKIADDPDNTSLFKDIELQVSETGILLKDDTKEIRYNWNAFIRKQENDDYYLLATNKVNAVIVPKRVFKTIADKEAFDHLLTAYLSFDAELAHLLDKS